MKALPQILLIALCGVGIYFSSETKSKFEDQVEKVNDLIGKNKTLDEKIINRETERDVEKKGFEAANADFIDKESNIALEKNKHKEIGRELASYESDLAAQQEELDKQQKLLKETKTAVAEALDKNPDEISVDTIAGDIESLKNTEKDRQTKLDELNSLIDTAEKRVAKNKTSIADLSARKERRDERIRSNNIEAVISAVDTDWGICTINAGTNMGFTPQTRLIVTRQNTLIGNIMPESISATETVAKINFDSLARGMSLQPGDHVILEKPLTD